MKKNNIIFVYFFILSIILRPLEIQAAYFDLDGSVVYTKPGLYQQLSEADRISKGTPDQWIKSGNYLYEFLDRQKRYITIRKIESDAVENGRLIIPPEIDGFKVLGISVFSAAIFEPSFMSAMKEYCVMDETEKIVELVLPEGLEFLGVFSFYGCSSLKRIVFPESLVCIDACALQGSSSLLEVTFPPDIYISGNAFGILPIRVDQIFNPKKIILYSDSLLDEDNDLVFSKERKPQIFIRFHKQKTFRFALRGYVDKIFVHKKLDCFYLLSCLSEEEDYAVSPPPSYKVKKLVMNGKDTCLQLPYFSDKHSVLNKDGYWISGVKGIYTVKGAASINEAREYKATYYWKETGKAEKVKAKKKNGVYRAEWKKIKTTVYKHEYKAKKRKWKVTKSPVQTVYKVYGKKKKNGVYRLFMTTKKKNIQSKYKYIKAAAVKEWE